MAKPLQIDIKGDVMTVTIDVSKAAYDEALASTSGKTKLVSSTHGFTGVQTPGGICQLALNLTHK
jgi:hypothetical protein